LRLTVQFSLDVDSRAHFYSVAANVIGMDFPAAPTLNSALLDDALQKLTAFDERKSQAITLKFFGGMTAEEIAAALRISVATVKQMMAQGLGGSVVNTASVGGLLAFPAAGPYVASKHAVLGLAKTAAIEYRRYGIRVNAVSPGAVKTEMLLDVFGSEEALEEMSAVHPIGPIGRPEEIADAVVWLSSNRSSYYTGQSLILDGGLTAQRPYVTHPLGGKARQ
jgi:A-factor type gamma-butyrolactone 1'-reductase (1S-forming)